MAPYEGQADDGTILVTSQEGDQRMIGHRIRDGEKGGERDCIRRVAMGGEGIGKREG